MAGRIEAHLRRVAVRLLDEISESSNPGDALGPIYEAILEVYAYGVEEGERREGVPREPLRRRSVPKAKAVKSVKSDSHDVVSERIANMDWDDPQAPSTSVSTSDTSKKTTKGKRKVAKKKRALPKKESDWFDVWLRRLELGRSKIKR